MADWYLRVLGLIPTDVQYLADGSPNLAFCRLDLGEQPADHHTLVLVGGIEEKYEHSAYEVVDLDALGQGQQVLRAQGHRHMWGIGRHVLGSQLFDYWFDPDGFEYEHYTDGDVFTADFETTTRRSSSAASGPGATTRRLSMKPKKNLRTLRARARAAAPQGDHAAAAEAARAKRSMHPPVPGAESTKHGRHDHVSHTHPLRRRRRAPMGRAVRTGASPRCRRRRQHRRDADAPLGADLVGRARAGHAAVATACDCSRR